MSICGLSLNWWIGSNHGSHGTKYVGFFFLAGDKSRSRLLDEDMNASPVTPPAQNHCSCALTNHFAIKPIMRATVAIWDHWNRSEFTLTPWAICAHLICTGNN